ncbi:MAG: endonuclease [Alphaproteobacteria bacterium]|nr:endonuclease [Alphaproteobacteria bacterium]
MPHRLRIATYNLENLHRGPDLAGRIAALRPRLLALDADILSLQEVNARRVDGAHRPRRMAALDSLIADTPYAGFARAATAGASGASMDKHNLAVLSRFPIMATRQFRHELVMPPRYRLATARPQAGAAEPIEWDRPALHVTVDLRGTPVEIMNLHLRAPIAALVTGRKERDISADSAAWAEGFFLAAIKRTGQALEARLLVDRSFDANPNALIAVAGDLNAHGHEMPVRLLVAAAEDTGNAALASRALIPVADALPPGDRFSVRHAGRPVLLDHILVSPALARWCRDVRIDNVGLADEVLGPAHGVAEPASYHAPVLATFELPDPGSA